MSLTPAEDKIRDRLVRKRAMVKGQLTSFSKILASFKEDKDVIRLRVHMERLEKAISNLDEITVDLQELEPDADHERTHEQIYEEWCDLIAKGRSLDEEAVSARSSEVTHNHSQSRSPTQQFAATRLPEQSLPKFDGKYEEWLDFQDDFQSSVGQRTDLSNASKLKYLRSCLRGEPERLVKRFGTTNDGYEQAWSLLKQTFEHKGKIVERHFAGIFAIPVMQRESPKELSELINKIEFHLASLQSLGETVWSSMMVHIILTKIDKATRSRFKQSQKGTAVPTYDELIKFLREAVISADEPLHKVSKDDRSPGTSQRGNAKFKNLATMASSPPHCSLCGDEHQLFRCHKFKNLQPKEKYQAATKAPVCINCLRSGHSARECTSKYTCRICSKKHHSWLHYTESSPSSDTATVSPANNTQASLEKKRSSSSAIASLVTSIPSKDLLVSAQINVFNALRELKPCRVLLDTCSNTNFMTEKLALALGVPQKKLCVPIGAMNNTQTVTNHLVTATIRSRLNDFERTLQFLTVDNIAGLVPDEKISRNSISIPRNIRLADPAFDRPAEVDMLIGSGPTLSSFCVGQINLSPPGGPDLYLQKTRLGWIIGGAIAPDSLSSYNRRCHVTNMEGIMKRFWEIEEIATLRRTSPEESKCEDHFRKTVCRDDDGRYIVALPFNEKRDQLGESRAMAMRRLNGIERKLNKNLELKGQYEAVLQEYLTLGHMTRVQDETSTQRAFYLPHHAVIKESSLTTKVRVVFDGSAKSSSGLSLNDTLMVGPTIQDDIFSLLLRFRIHQYVLTGDIEKMYRQFMVRQEDRNYQRILWRDMNGQVATYELNTVTFGLSPAPFLATRCLQQLADDEAENFPAAAQVLRRDLYVDDLLTGAATFDEALKLRDEINNLLQRGGLNIRQWASNEPSLLHGLPSNSINLKLQSREDQTIKTLGVHWNSEQDAIVYTVSTVSPTNRASKRSVLSHIAKIFDPLGLLGPVVTHAKLIMQQLWREKLDWDESIPSHIHTEWINYASQLSLLNNLTFHRKIVPPGAKEIQLHGFCDASERAYGACIYIRATDHNGHTTITLLCAKSRVAPLKKISEEGPTGPHAASSEMAQHPTEEIPPMTIPKLELCGAALLAKLYSTVHQALNIEIDKIVFWCDNTAVLHWINTPPYQLLPFVGNRVSMIQTLTNKDAWRHVRSRDNPADLISRGQLPSEFIIDKKWKNGPAWLSDHEDTWPRLGIPTIEQLPGLRKVKCFAATLRNGILERYSSITRLRRFICYAMRFKNPRQHHSCLTIEELQSANIIILKLVQASNYSEELKELEMGHLVDSKSKLLSLSPFLDDKGLIRVGGRLKNSTASFSEKHPILLPPSHHVTDLIIRYEHLVNYHSGAQSTLYALRRKYWITNGRRAVRKILRNCIICAKARPPSAEYIMGNLPSIRVTEARPFINVGVDYCGPFYIKEKKERNRSKIKTYVAVFVCLVVKAVHLELVSDLSTEAFLAALKRFISRRGKCKNIYSDNGTNFVGANNEMKQIMDHMRVETHKEEVINFFTEHGIKWHFIPPQSPNFGGIWEAAVKSFKHHLRRVVGEQLLTFEQLYTFLTEVEAILNSRPMTPLSSDPNDPPVLSPGHYIIGSSLTSIPEVDFNSTPYNRLSLWQHIQKMKQDFWTRWHKEYLNELSSRHKWSKGGHSIQEGSLVLLKEDNLPPLRWLMGRVIETRPGADGVTRVVRVKTARGILDRNVRKLAPLPINSDSESSDLRKNDAD